MERHGWRESRGEGRQRERKRDIYIYIPPFFSLSLDPSFSHLISLPPCPPPRSLSPSLHIHTSIPTSPSPNYLSVSPLLYLPLSLFPLYFLHERETKLVSRGIGRGRKGEKSWLVERVREIFKEKKRKRERERQGGGINYDIKIQL